MFTQHLPALASFPTAHFLLAQPKPQKELFELSIQKPPFSIDQLHEKKGKLKKIIILTFMSILFIILVLPMLHSQNESTKKDEHHNTKSRMLTSSASFTEQQSQEKAFGQSILPRWKVIKGFESLPPTANALYLPPKQLTSVLFTELTNNLKVMNEAPMMSGITNKMMQLGQHHLNSLKDHFSKEQQLEVIKFQRQYYSQKYKTQNYDELPICVVVPTYNNAKNDRYKYNMKSIIGQNYQNYHIVIMDDASSDQTGSLIEKYLKENEFPESRYTMVQNEVQMKAMPNLRRAAKEFCQENQIFLIVDGDDYLLGHEVLKFYNSVFQERQVWFMYSNFLNMDTNTVGYSQPFPQSIIQSNGYRVYPFVTSHLRAFYTKLFLLIKEEDLKDTNGNYYQSANDVAICIPILEMSHKRVVYVPEITYGYNSNTGLNNHNLKRFEQRSNDQQVRTKDRYKAVENLFEEKKADSKNNK